MGLRKNFMGVIGGGFAIASLVGGGYKTATRPNPDNENGALRFGKYTAETAWDISAGAVTFIWDKVVGDNEENKEASSTYNYMDHPMARQQLGDRDISDRTFG